MDIPAGAPPGWRNAAGPRTPRRPRNVPTGSGRGSHWPGPVRSAPAGDRRRSSGTCRRRSGSARSEHRAAPHGPDDLPRPGDQQFPIKVAQGSQTGSDRDHLGLVPVFGQVVDRAGGDHRIGSGHGSDHSRFVVGTRILPGSGSCTGWCRHPRALRPPKWCRSHPVSVHPVSPYGPVPVRKASEPQGVAYGVVSGSSGPAPSAGTTDRVVGAA